MPPPRASVARMANRAEDPNPWPALLAGLFLTGVVFLTLFRFELDMLESVVLGLANAALGLVALVVALVAHARGRRPIGRATIGLVIGTWLVWLLAPLSMVGAQVRFRLDRDTYDAAVAVAAAGGTPDCVRTRRCQLDDGPPRRVAFAWDGLIDNWYGVVHDPDGQLRDAPEAHRNVFGGALVVCRALADDYYFCTFT